MREERLIVVDDEPKIGALVREVAEEMGYAVELTRSAKDFRRRYKTFQPTAIVIDVLLPEEDGIELLGFLRQEGSDARVVMISGGDSRILRAAERLGVGYGLRVVASLKKPFGLEALCTALVPPATPQPGDRG